MKTIKIEGSIYYHTNWKEFYFITISFDSSFWESENAKDQIKIAPYTIEIELDGDVENMIYDRTLSYLQNQRKLILAENEKRIQEIDNKIAEHLAIENKE